MIIRSELKDKAKQSLSGNWGLAIGTTVIEALIIAAASNFAGIGGIILSGPMSIGLAIIFLQIIRGWKCEFADLFKGFNNFGPNCLAGILLWLYVLLWSLLFIIPGIVKSYSYSMTYYILADRPELSANEAITESRRMMDGHKGDLFVLDLSFIGWGLLCVLTFGIGFLWLYPYIEATRVAFYEKLKESNSLNEEPV